MNAPFGAPLIARKSPSNVYANVGKQIEGGRHVGLDFYDLLIEALKSPVTESISVMGIFRQLPYPFSLATV